MSSAMHTYRMKRSCLHNVRIQISEKDCNKEIPEGLEPISKLFTG